VVYASGGAVEIKQLRPMFAGFTRAVHDVGAFGNGSRMKYVANLLSPSTTWRARKRWSWGSSPGCRRNSSTI